MCVQGIKKTKKYILRVHIILLYDRILYVSYFLINTTHTCHSKYYESRALKYVREVLRK